MFLQLYIPPVLNLDHRQLAINLQFGCHLHSGHCQNMLWPGGQQTVSCLVHQSQSKSKGHILKKWQISCSTYRNFTPFKLTSPSPGPASDSGSCCTSAGIPDNKALLVNTLAASFDHQDTMPGLQHENQNNETPKKMLMVNKEPPSPSPALPKEAIVQLLAGRGSQIRKSKHRTFEAVSGTCCGGFYATYGDAITAFLGQTHTLRKPAWSAFSGSSLLYS